MRAIFFITSCALAAGIPYFSPRDVSSMPLEIGGMNGVKGKGSFPGWPVEFEGRTLTQLPLREHEKRFEAEYPGRFGRFTDGQREILLRFVADRTRKLHPSADCFKACGYRVQPLPLWVDENNFQWGCFNATRKIETLWVYERIYDLSGNSWTDVSAWYWSALLGQTKGPWWAITLAEKQSRQSHMDTP